MSFAPRVRALLLLALVPVPCGGFDGVAKRGTAGQLLEPLAECRVDTFSELPPGLLVQFPCLGGRNSGIQAIADGVASAVEAEVKAPSFCLLRHAKVQAVLVRQFQRSAIGLRLIDFNYG